MQGSGLEAASSGIQMTMAGVPGRFLGRGRTSPPRARRAGPNIHPSPSVPTVCEINRRWGHGANEPSLSSPLQLVRPPRIQLQLTVEPPRRPPLPTNLVTSSQLHRIEVE